MQTVPGLFRMTESAWIRGLVLPLFRRLQRVGWAGFLVCLLCLASAAPCQIPGKLSDALARVEISGLEGWILEIEMDPRLEGATTNYEYSSTSESLSLVFGIGPLGTNGKRVRLFQTPEKSYLYWNDEASIVEVGTPDQFLKKHNFGILPDLMGRLDSQGFLEESIILHSDGDRILLTNRENTTFRTELELTPFEDGHVISARSAYFGKALQTRWTHKNWERVEDFIYPGKSALEVFSESGEITMAIDARIINVRRATPESPELSPPEFAEGRPFHDLHLDLQGWFAEGNNIRLTKDSGGISFGSLDLPEIEFASTAETSVPESSGGHEESSPERDSSGATDAHGNTEAVSSTTALEEKRSGLLLRHIVLAVVGVLGLILAFNWIRKRWA